MTDFEHTIEAQAVRIEELEAEWSAALTALHEIKQWVDAYPTTVFGKVSEADLATADQVLKTAGLSLSAIHAQWARHILGGLSQILKKAIKPED